MYKKTGLYYSKLFKRKLFRSQSFIGNRFKNQFHPLILLQQDECQPTKHMSKISGLPLRTMIPRIFVLGDWPDNSSNRIHP